MNRRTAKAKPKMRQSLQSIRPQEVHIYLTTDIRVHITSAAISQPIIDVKKLSFDADIFKDITTGGLSGPWCLILLWVKASQAELNFCRMLPLIQIILRVLRAQNKQLTRFLRRSNLSEWPTWRATCPSNIQMQVRDLELPSFSLV